MDPELAAFLARHPPLATDPVDWGDGLRFRVAVSLGDDPPPLAFVTSARAVVLRGVEVLVQRDRDGRHILPGGRREPGEPPEATLRRELLEETGWTLAAPSLLGVLHFRHRDPAPPDHPAPAPDFLQVVYAGRASTYSAAAKLDDGFELETVFLPVAAARALDLTRCELVLLDAATARLG